MTSQEPLFQVCRRICSRVEEGLSTHMLATIMLQNRVNVLCGRHLSAEHFPPERLSGIQRSFQYDNHNRIDTGFVHVLQLPFNPKRMLARNIWPYLPSLPLLTSTLNLRPPAAHISMQGC